MVTTWRVGGHMTRGHTGQGIDWQGSMVVYVYIVYVMYNVTYNNRKKGMELSRLNYERLATRSNEAGGFSGI